MTTDVFKYLKHFTINEKNYKGQPAWGDANRISGLLLRLLDEIREEAGASILIHAGVEMNGHAPDSFHKKGLAIDFHFKGITPQKGYEAIQRVLAKHQLQDKVGLGFYSWWQSKGWHFDIRGYQTYWLSEASGSYSYDKARLEAKLKTYTKAVA